MFLGQGLLLEYEHDRKLLDANNALEVGTANGVAGLVAPVVVFPNPENSAS